MFSARDLCREAERELGYRRRVYGRLIENGKMTRSHADSKIAMMEQIRADYDAKAIAEERKGELPL